MSMKKIMDVFYSNASLLLRMPVNLIKLFVHATLYVEPQRISSDKASNLPKRDVRFILLETTHIQQIYIDEPSMHHCPQFVYLKRGFLHACNNST